MNTKKVLAALALSATMAFGATGLAACTPEENKGGESGERDLQIYAIYELYAETAGDDAMTYDQWYANLLETAKGAKGDNGKSAYDIWKENGHTGTEQDFLNSLKGTDGTPGAAGKSAYQLWLDAGNTGTEQDFLNSLKGTNGTTPEITISDDGYWEINGQKTSQKAQGENGSTPEITISDDGYWEINGQKTSQKAQGENGQPGTRGNKITKGEGAPTLTEGAIEGDMYVDTKEWNVYFFEGGSWKNYGSIKGADGGSSEVEPAPAGTEVDIVSDGQKEIDVTLSEGVHIIKADLGETTLTTGRLQAKVGEVTSELILSETRSEAAGGNKIYYGYVDIKADTSKITIMAKGEAVKGTITFEDYTMPTIEVGTAVEMPINANGTAAESKLKVKVGTSVQESTQYNIYVIADSSLNSFLQLHLDDSALGMISVYGDASKNTKISISAGKLTEGEHYFSLIHAASAGADCVKVIYPATVTLSVAES